MPQAVLQQIQARLHRVYAEEAAQEAYQGVLAAIEAAGITPPSGEVKWDQKDVLLITYGDTFLNEEEVPLSTLKKFLSTYVKDAVNCVHVLPFFPYSSDDGFSVIDYTMVDPELGDWENIEALREKYDLMFDLVVNHVSRESLWFTDYKADIAPYNEFFIEENERPELSLVTRPRNTPLLVPAYTHRGRKKVWATFSADQIDLNFANPKVLVKMIEVLLLYLKNGARIIRLDAIAFLWKRIGTNCIHLPETHEVVKLMRDVMSIVRPDAILLTETNVPHAENLSYFGSQDEAHMVYQFSLAPLVLHALHRGDGSYLTDWALNLEAPPPGCTFLNFTASHDGIGLRPVEGILPPREVEDLVTNMHRLGGFVSMKANGDGTESPYEINIALFSAFRETHNSNGPDQWQVERFICAQNIMMTLQGIPAFYIHSMVATPNDHDGVEKTGRTRSINRRKWEFEYLQALIESGRTSNAEVVKRLTNLLQRRKKHKAFHPETPQQVLDLGSDYFALWRDGEGLRFPLLAIHNLTPEIKILDLSVIEGFDRHNYWINLLDNQGVFSGEQRYVMQPYQSIWLMPEQIGGESALWALSTD
ncbi:MULTISPECIES: sugar phosphorylase [Thiomicrorhabdus]|uniref:Sugar phosphorylase n=1 Tax=Thiomicrorhabdus heinhorstiae TaxID=2748010 RepID=A0ABS0BUQ8_9GAMM|nr:MULTISPECIES: sugar phosphorylase [Thiomicrorhabdus]MBF6057562.1 sugar phosphorylase [Thiomicrorhabdus heinhorstiae]